jgi:protein transport protein SEC24
VFIIDLSLSSYQSGFLTSVLEIIKDLLSNSRFTNSERTKIGLITYDTSVQFYKIQESNNNTTMLNVANPEVFLPAPVK